jgi:ornithine--oxo-acid transaminase
MDAPRLAAILAERLLKEVPYLDKVLFANSGGEAVEAAMKFARASTGRSGIVYYSSKLLLRKPMWSWRPSARI